MTMLHETPTLTAVAPQMLLGNHLKALKLPTFAREYEKVAMESAQDRADYPRYLLRLCELERIDRERRNVERRIRLARFPQTKSLDTFDFTAQPSLNKPLVLELARCEWIEKRRNCIALGPSGTGKTHVALALGLAAWRLCALWDSPGEDKENILTVVDHIDSPCVLDMLSEDMRQFWRNSDLGCRDELGKAIKSAKEIRDSSKLAGIMNLRHKRLAHSLAQTRGEKRGTVFQPIEPGHETELLEDSIPIVEALFTWVNGVSLSIAECREFRRKNAHALWTGCTFTNLR